MMRTNNTARHAKSAQLIVCFLMLFSRWCPAQTSTGKLTVSANIQGSIGLVFNNNPAVGTSGFCPLTNAGTNNVGLNLGTASYTTGDSQSCVAFFRAAGFYLVSSAFDVVVTKANSTSANYHLAAGISSVPPANVFWDINGTLLNTGFTTFQNANNYGAPVTETLNVIVNQTVPQQTLFETINFLATAN